MKRLRTTRGSALLISLAILGLIASTTLNPYHLDLGVTLLEYLAIAQAWNILGGFGGQVSLGAAAFVGTGGYAAGLLMLHTGASWEIGLLVAAGAAALLALVLSLPLLRLRGDYFSVGTLAAAIALQGLVNNWQWAGGAIGITVPIEKAPTGAALFRIALGVAVLSVAAALFVSRSKFGLRLTAVRDNEDAAVGLGVSAYRHRLAALVLSSVITGLAGSVIAFQFGAIAPDGVYGLTWSLNALLMTIVGGAGTVGGPIAGVLVVYYGLTKQFENTQTLAVVIEGVMLIAIVRFAPGGIWSLLTKAPRFAARLVSNRHRGVARAEPESIRDRAEADSIAEDLLVTPLDREIA